MSHTAAGDRAGIHHIYIIDTRIFQQGGEARLAAGTEL